GARDADGLSADADAATIEGHHRDLETAVELTKERIVVDRALVEFEGDRVRSAEAHLVFGATNAQARGSSWNQETRDSTRSGQSLAITRSRPHDEDSRVRTARNPLLCAAKNPPVILFGRRGFHPTGIAAGTRFA